MKNKGMTDGQFAVCLELIIIVAEKSKNKNEFLSAMKRIKNKKGATASDEDKQ